MRGSLAPTYDFLSPSNCIMLFSDNYQSGLVSLVQNLPLEGYWKWTKCYIEMARAYGIPVVVVANAQDGPNGPLDPKFRKAFTKESKYPPIPLEVGKTYFPRNGPINPMDCPKVRAVVEAYKRNGRDKVLINGIATDVCVAFPALTLKSEGYDVYVQGDSSGTTTDYQQKSAWDTMLMEKIKIVTWFYVGCALQRNWLDEKLNAQYGRAEPLLTMVKKYYPNYMNLINSKYEKPDPEMPCDNNEQPIVQSAMTLRQPTLMSPRLSQRQQTSPMQSGMYPLTGLGTGPFSFSGFGN